MILAIGGCDKTPTHTISDNDKPPAPLAVNLDKASVKFAQDLILNDNLTALQGGEALITKEDAMNNFNISEVIDSRILSKDYDANEVAADNKYKTTKYILVTGKILGISKDFLGDPYVTLPGQQMFSGVQAKFNKDYLETLAKLAKGQTLSVVCKVLNKIITNVMLNDCATLEDYAKSIRPAIDTHVFDVLAGKTRVSSDGGEAISLGYALPKYLPSDSLCYKNMDDSKCGEDFVAATKDPALKADAKMVFTTLKLKQ
ncbi:tRNA_anti-like [Nitrosospira sp. Nsp1]|nr:tRNA_anti-like [Nitrosospira sp. Nsp1]